jgi:hypothetical protein
VDQDAIIIPEAEEKTDLSVRGGDAFVVHGTPFVDHDCIT